MNIGLLRLEKRLCELTVPSAVVLPDIVSAAEIEILVL
jgi:hypothetical protein